MAIIRVKGLKRYRVKGRWYAYHRKSGVRLKSEFGTAEFIAELETLERKLRKAEALPGTMGKLFASYRASPAFTDLAITSRNGYSRMMNLLNPLDEMPLVELTPQFIAGLRDKMAERHGRRQANYVMAVISVACEHGKEHGIIRENPVKGVKRVRRSRIAPAANRPWTIEECRTVLTELPHQLKLPVALAMFTGLRKGDVLALRKSAIRSGRIWRRTNKTGLELSIPIHPDLAQILAGSPHHNAITVAATTNATPWTESGFNSSFIKAMATLKRSGRIGDGLTFHGLRHTVGTLLIEAGYDIDTVRRWLGQKTLAMAIHYSESADTSQRMREVITKLDPLGSKSRT
ncbi:tyrosine-type recombinase/integrase [Bradyrhizobium septentrionale]|uniref:Tyrosine-type recombinase/integrase n=1 Tax=Bradyrhizobium septentrionale TaxID=1404411 RepID=A0A974A633_9BRAD|nr:tyrosine-type recombinase/integrase [Bradyrhizobium septentrionale]UGY17996.1 tyrosine-type recombinase/integrase [Bradyrhizobium septentrionale]